MHVEGGDVSGIVGDLLPPGICSRRVGERRNVQILFVLYPVNHQRDQGLGRGGRVKYYGKVVFQNFYIRTYLVSENQRVLFWVVAQRVPVNLQLLVLGSWRRIGAEFLRAGEKERLAIRQPGRRC